MELSSLDFYSMKNVSINQSCKSLQWYAVSPDSKCVERIVRKPWIKEAICWILARCQEKEFEITRVL